MTAKVIIKCLLEGRVKAIAPPRRGLFVITVAQLAMDFLPPPPLSVWLAIYEARISHVLVSDRQRTPSQKDVYV